MAKDFDPNIGKDTQFQTQSVNKIFNRQFPIANQNVFTVFFIAKSYVFNVRA